MNSGVRAGVIRQLQHKYGEHIKFFWCLSHRLELAIKDALKNDMEEIDTAMRDLFYTYQNSGKRLRELRVLHEILKDVYEFENEEVKPTKSTGTRWIDHKLRAMRLFIDKRGLYLSHIQNVIADTTKKNDKAKLEGIRKRIAHGSVLLKCAMYVDILEPARQLSLTTQKTEEINIIKQVEAVDRTLKKYKIMLAKVDEDPAAAASSLPTVKYVLSVIEEGPDESSLYQGVKVTNLTQGKTSLGRVIKDNVGTIYQSLAKRYGSLVDNSDDGTESCRETREADEIAHSAAKILNSTVWMPMKEPSAESLKIQLEALLKVFNNFASIPQLCLSSKEQVCEQYVMLVHWATAFFNVDVLDPLDLWPRMKNLKQDEAKDLFLLIELCLTCPYGNSVCESFISYLRVVKTDWRNRLNESNLTDLLRIKVTGPNLKEFNEEFCDAAIILWNDAKRRRPNQTKRKAYKERSKGGKRTRAMERNEYLKDWLVDIGVDEASSTESESDNTDSEPNNEDPVIILEDSEQETIYSVEDDPLDCGMRSSSEAESD